MPQWLYLIKPELNISVNEEDAFRFACFNGHLIVAQWLYSIKPDLNISVRNDFAFRGACFWGHLIVAQWLMQIKPNINTAIDDYEFSLACSININFMFGLICYLLI